jgi:hypothetical protein
MSLESFDEFGDGFAFSFGKNRILRRLMNPVESGRNWMDCREVERCDIE